MEFMDKVKTITKEQTQDTSVDLEIEASDATRYRNKLLIKRFPFLEPRNVWTGKKITGGAGFWAGSPEAVPEYDYEWTLLDEMPDGWRAAFGEQMCQEIEDVLEAEGLQDKYYPIQIKEKYGALRWYSNFSTKKLDEIVYKYEDLSEKTCIVCGKPAMYYTVNWISPYCDDCAQRASTYDRVITADEYWSEEYWNEDDEDTTVDENNLEFS